MKNSTFPIDVKFWRQSGPHLLIEILAGNGEFGSLFQRYLISVFGIIQLIQFNNLLIGGSDLPALVVQKMTIDGDTVQ